MNLTEFLTLTFWNNLAGAHLPELVMILTAAIVALSDRYIRRFISNWTSSFNKVSRFMVFLLTVSVGYAALALGVAHALRAGFSFSQGTYAAPVVLGVLLIAAVEAQRQRQA